MFTIYTGSNTESGVKLIIFIKYQNSEKKKCIIGYGARMYGDIYKITKSIWPLSQKRITEC